MWSGFLSFLSRPHGSRRLLPAIAAVVAFACAGRSTFTAADDDTTSDAAGRGGKSGRAGSPGTGGSMQLAGRGGTAGQGTGGTTSDPPYMDPGCPDAAAPAGVKECNVFDTVSTCGPGLACKPDIEHPYGSGCDQQVFNMRCTVPGTGEQGEPCGSGKADCADGFICVLGASHGAVCLRMCPLDGSTSCPSGYVCGPTDADGVGVCA